MELASTFQSYPHYTPATIVAESDAVWVKHGHYLEDEQRPEEPCLRAFPCEEIQHTSHHPTRGRLPWMDTGADHDTAFSSTTTELANPTPDRSAGVVAYIPDGFTVAGGSTTDGTMALEVVASIGCAK